MKIKQLFLALFLLISQGISAQENFTYDANGAIVGLTQWGMVAETLTIPSTVTTVRSGAFCDAVNLTTLIIENGNPEFEEKLFDTKTSTIVSISLGSEMTTGNIRKLVLSLGTGSPLETIEMERYADETAVIDWTDNDVSAILTDKVFVRLPAPLVKSQVFGNAIVQGRFDISGELKTFCGTATFEDTDDGSHMLFYVPTDFIEQAYQVYIQRVSYIVEGEGVVIHNLESSSTHAYLKRVETNKDHKDALYASSMMVGVITPTYITPTVDVDGISYTNLGLASNGIFHPLNAGTVPANRAYLQIETSVWESLDANISLLIPDEETDAIREADTFSKGRVSDFAHWFTLDGRRLNGKPLQSGTYIHAGRLIVVK